MVMFHSYVKLPEGKFPGSGQRNSIDFDQNLGKCYSWTHPQAPNGAPNGSKWHTEFCQEFKLLQKNTRFEHIVAGSSQAKTGRQQESKLAQTEPELWPQHVQGITATVLVDSQALRIVQSYAELPWSKCRVLKGSENLRFQQKKHLSNLTWWALYIYSSALHSKTGSFPGAS